MTAPVMPITLDGRTDGRAGVDRRTILAGAAAALAMAWSSKAWGTQKAPQLADAADGDDHTATLSDFSGLYLAGDRQIGIDRFINDAGRSVLLFADFETGAVRSLFQQADRSFVMGRTFADPAPVETTLQFEPATGSAVEAVTLTSADGVARRALKLATRDLDISFEQDGATLAGTLILPPGAGPHPAIILLHGSGPLTRSSFGPYPRFFSSLGLAVLIYDKRGTGLSNGQRLDASTGRPDVLSPAYYPDNLSSDALAALKVLQDRPEIDAGRIGFWGSSEGGMLTTQVAARSRDVAFIINSVGFMGRLADTILYQGAAKMEAAGKPAEEIAEAVAFNSMWMEVGRSGTGFDQFQKRRASVVAGGKSDWLFYEDAGFTSQEQLSWTMNHILDFNSLPDVSRVTCPALGLFGEKDVLTDAHQASANMLQALQTGGNEDAMVKVIPDATHSLMDANTRARMAPGVFQTLRGWLLARTWPGLGVGHPKFAAGGGA